MEAAWDPQKQELRLGLQLWAGAGRSWLGSSCSPPTHLWVAPTMAYLFFSIHGSVSLAESSLGPWRREIWEVWFPEETVKNGDSVWR